MKTINYRTRKGFTLVEIMIVVVIIGILMTMITNAFKIVRSASQNTATINDLRIFAGVFDTYAMENGSFPADEPAGEIPDDMHQYFPGGDPSQFTKRPPIGGSYKWDYFGVGNEIEASVSVRGAIVPADQLLSLDQKSDDGVAGSGNVRILGTDVLRIVAYGN